MYRLRRFGVVRTATVVGLMYALLVGIILMPILLLVGVAGVQTDPATVRIGEPGSDLGAGTAGPGALGVAGLLLVGLLAALLYGIVGWILTAIVCLLYNLVARWTGGIEVQVVQAPPPEAMPSWGPTRPAAPAGPAEPPA